MANFILAPDLVFPAAAAASTSITLTDQGEDLANTTAHSIASMDFGAADAGRYIAVTIHAASNSATFGVSSCTIGGVSATVVASATGNNGNLRQEAAIAIAAVPTGTSGTVAVNWVQSHFICYVTVHRILGIDGVTASDSGVSENAQPLTDTLTTTTDGVTLCAASCDDNTATAAWTGITERVDVADGEGRNRVSVASDVEDAGGSTALTCTYTTSTAFDAAAFAHWAPA